MNILEEFYYQHKKSFEYALWHIRTKKYVEKKISKKNGGERILYIPPPFTKIMQSKLNDILETTYKAPNPVHGFIKKDNGNIRNIITNASKHTNKQVVINIDIENFFDTINFGRVRGLFLSKPFNCDKFISTRLAQLTIFNNKLPQGAPTSPIISNLICKKLDHQLIKLAKNYSLTYTRYADDLTFSSYKKNIDIENIIKNIENIINENGFKINLAKTRIQTKNHSQVVTGLKVNKKVNVNRKFVRQIRSMLFSWYKNGLTEATKTHFNKYNLQPNKYQDNKEESFKNILIGKINFLGQVKGKDNLLFIKYRHTYYLLKHNFLLKEKLDEFEELDIKNLKKHKVEIIFNQIYNSILVFTEGETDILYIKNALKYFQEQNKYKNLKLRFCNLRGWVNVKNMHSVFYNETKDLSIINMRKCIAPYLSKDLKFVFVLDADDKGIRGYFNNQKIKNHFLLDEENQGYIEKLFDKKIIIKYIEHNGYEIDPTRAKDKTKEKLENHLKNNADKEDIFSIDNYIVYKSKLIKKTELANYIVNKEDVKYDLFKSLFDFLIAYSHKNDYVSELCCNSIY